MMEISAKNDRKWRKFPHFAGTINWIQALTNFLRPALDVLPSVKVYVTYICQVMLSWSPEGQHVDDSGEPLLDKDFFYTLR